MRGFNIALVELRVAWEARWMAKYGLILLSQVDLRELSPVPE